jgi:hypothetical protein
VGGAGQTREESTSAARGGEDQTDRDRDEQHHGADPDGGEHPPPFAGAVDEDRHAR